MIKKYHISCSKPQLYQVGSTNRAIAIVPMCQWCINEQIFQISQKYIFYGESKINIVWAASTYIGTSRKRADVLLLSVTCKKVQWLNRKIKTKCDIKYPQQFFFHNWQTICISSRIDFKAIGWWVESRTGSTMFSNNYRLHFFFGKNIFLQQHISLLDYLGYGLYYQTLTII